MKKMYIVTYHTGEYESSAEFNIAVMKTQEEAELFIEDVVAHWNSSDYDSKLNFILNPNDVWSLKFQIGKDFNPDSFNITVVPFYEI